MKTQIAVLLALIGLLVGSFCRAAESGVTNQPPSVVYTNQIVGGNVPVQLVPATNTVHNEFLATVLAGEMTRKSDETLWYGVGMKTYFSPDKKESTDVFSFRRPSWPKGWVIQYWDEYPLVSGMTIPRRSFFLVREWKF